MIRRTLIPTSIKPRAVLAVAILATCACSLIPLDSLTGGSVAVPPDAGDAGEDAPLPPPTPYAQAVLADDPVAYWRLDETRGQVARDFSGHGNDATYIGGVHAGTAGAIAGDPDTAATFDGATGYLDGSDRFAFAGSEPFSVEAWVRSASMQGYGGLFSREDTSGGPLPARATSASSPRATAVSASSASTATASRPSPACRSRAPPTTTTSSRPTTAT